MGPCRSLSPSKRQDSSHEPRTKERVGEEDMNRRTDGCFFSKRLQAGVLTAMVTTRAGTKRSSHDLCVRNILIKFVG